MTKFILLIASVTVVLLTCSTTYDAYAQNVPCSKTYTVDADFDLGNLINVNHDSPNNDQLQLNDVTAPPPYIWVACSARGTAVRIDVATGEILGEYRTAPDNQGKNPSRTTVDQYGNVWIGNRDEAADGLGSVVKIGIVIGGTRCNADGTPNPSGQYLKPPFQYCTAVDRDADGLIKTSTGLGNYLPWTNEGGIDSDGGVETADDECIILYVRTLGTNIRTIAVDANNDVWVGGFGNKIHQHLDGETGASMGSFNNGRGGYGGLIDGNGVLWSASFDNGYLLRANVTADPITWSTIDVGWYSYGLGIDGSGNIYNTTWTTNTVVKIAPDGTVLNTWPTGGSGNRGVAITSDGHIWVANSYSASVSHISPTGSLIKAIGVGSTPTGVAVDANGKVWVTNYGSNSVMRIDPAAYEGKGGVDLTVGLGTGANPYNYSDMTGAVALGATTWTGSWSITQAGVDANTEWGTVSWNATVPTGTSIKVETRTGSNSWLDITAYNGVPLCGTGNAIVGASLTVRVTLVGDAENDISPVLEDLTIALCDNAAPVPDVDPLTVVTGECSATITVTPTATDYCEGTIPGTTTDPLYYDQQGTFSVLWTYDDGNGNTSMQTQTVIVDDVTPPVLTLNTDLSMWPPNHGYTIFTVANMVASVTDNCNTALDVSDVKIMAAASDEYENAIGDGDGNTVDDIVIANDCISVMLRSERAGALNGRVYTITLAVDDGNGNVTTEYFQVQVTHDMAGYPAIDDGLANGYAVTSACGIGPAKHGHVSAGPEVCTLEQNYPNPFNPTTSIRYSIAEADHLSLKVYDIFGRQVAVLVDGVMPAGSYEVSFDGSGVVSGTYLYILTSNGRTLQRTMSLMK
ncbi:MAG: T9SS type A sorting domain-containing protein [Bacteroidetes bacterium]|nr:T9SS type A sorting domain-containing protein [Bacteroidota bacterium]